MYIRILTQIQSLLVGKREPLGAREIGTPGRLGVGIGTSAERYV